MGTTGSSEKIAINAALPEIISRVREYATVPLAVGFGVATRDQFNMVAEAGADGVVIGSRLVGLIKNAPHGEVANHVETYCKYISSKGGSPDLPVAKSKSLSAGRTHSDFAATVVDPASKLAPLTARFGQFGGQYVPEALFDCLSELEEAHKSAISDPAFWKEFESYFGYMNRPSKLYFAEKLTAHAGGAKIWLKREDLYVSRIFSIKTINQEKPHSSETTLGHIKLTTP
jgi:tryptophan synthase